jgi:hypothetical protein
MVEDRQIETLKNVLRKEVALLCRNDNRFWKTAIARTIGEIKEKRWPAVFFGGTLRSLLISRLTRDMPGRPRDIDIVLGGTTIEQLEHQFDQWIWRRTRFGGLALRRKGWQFDLWPVNETYAFKQTGEPEPEFADLPKTTFLNIEAIAVEVWPQPGRPRRIYSWDDQFFTGILTRTLEVNRRDNPYSELSVLRALVMANHLKWKIGPRLGRFLARHGPRISPTELIDIQKNHYGFVRLPWEIYERMLDRVLNAVAHDQETSIEFRFPFEKQINLWSEADTPSPKSQVRVIVRTRKTKSHKLTFSNLSILER